MTPLLGSILRSGSELVETFYFLFTSLKGTDEHSDGMFIEQVMWERLWRFHIFSGHPTLPAPLCVFTTEALQPLYIWDLWKPHPIGMVD